MVEIETVLMPIVFGATHPERFLGVAQILTDVTALAGRTISFERLVSSNLVREGESVDKVSAPVLPANEGWRTHPRAPHLRLVPARESAGQD
jgi:hypothetical protein